MAITIDGTNGLSSDNAALKLDGTTLAVDETNNRVGVGTASPAVAMDVVGQVRASTGILFGSDTAAANALDDYEEGTWEPTMRGSTTAGTTTYSAQQAWYTKIGNTVHVGGYVQWSNATGTGSLQIGNLPFTTNGTYYSHFAFGLQNIAMTAGNYGALMETVLNDTRINFYQTPTGGGSLTAIPIDVAGGVFFGGVYNI